jgi:hypothetical protein
VTAEDETEEGSESESDEKPAEVTTEAEEPESTAEEEQAAEDEASDAEPEATNGKLANHRPAGKSTPRRRRRLRGGVAVED